MTARLVSFFPHGLAFDPTEGLEAFLARVPAKWAVYLMADQNDRPVQLLCVKNLRASLRRRLGEEALPEPSRRVDYRQIVRRIYWRRVDGALEADWVYLEAARAIFPESYRGMLGFDAAWFVHVDPDAPFPRYVKTTDLRERPGLVIGPIEDKHSAARLIELVEDSFDLCRYYNILVQAPQGKACAYKEMGKCPAPCDGSIAMASYRGMIQRSAEAMVRPLPLMREHERRMRDAAEAMEFEAAGRIKAYVEQLAQFGRGPYRHARQLRDFVFVSLQRGPWAKTAKLFLITPGRIDEVAGLIGDPASASDLLRDVLALAENRRGEPIDDAGIERIAVVSQHLFSPKSSQGVFVPLEQVDDRALAGAWRALQKQKAQADSDDEGVVKELQAM